MNSDNRLTRHSGGGLRRKFGLLLAIIVIVALVVLVRLVLDLDREVTQSLAQYDWQLPSKVYARPLEMHPGLDIKASEVVDELKLLGYQQLEVNDTEPEGTTTPLSGKFSIEHSATGDRVRALEIQTREFEFVDYTEPALVYRIEFDQQGIESIKLNKTEANLIRLEPLLIGSIHPTRHEDRQLVSVEELPPGFIEALLSVEDRGFYSHHGISLKGIARALFVNLKSGSRAQGASTITQQLIKNLFLDSSKTYTRKLKEAVMSIIVESRYSKEQILELFVNEVFIAQDGNRAIHGFGLAAQHFFDRPLLELQPQQYALLIGMIKAPSSYHPRRYPDKAMHRRSVVLKLMQEQGLIQPSEFDELNDKPLDISSESGFSGHQNAYLDLVRRQLITDYSLEQLQSGSMRIFTNFDPLLQQQVESSIEKIVAPAESSEAVTAAKDAALQAAVIVSNPTTGEISALVGGRKSLPGSFNRALDARRPVGSVLKPAVFLTALQQPANYNLASLLDDTPLTLTLPNGNTWSPANYNDTTNGEVLALDALSRSLNLATAKLGLDLGVDSVIKTLKKLGAENEFQPLPSLLLGAVEMSTMDVLRLYQTIASNGYTMPLRTIRDVVDANGTRLNHYPFQIEQVFSPQTMYLLRYALVNTMLQGTGRQAYQSLPQSLLTAGKTGTTNQQRDSWFAGFSDDLLAVVWVGRDNNLSTPFTGSSGALKIWTDFMRHKAKHGLDITPPAGVGKAAIDPTTGRRTRDNCQTAVVLPFVAGYEPSARITCRGGRGSSINRWFKSLFD